MKKINPWKYDIKVIQKAIAMRKKGYDCIAISQELGFATPDMVYYYTSPGRREDRAKNVNKWRMKNRKRDLMYKRAYSLKYSRQKRALAKKLKIK